MPESSSRAEDSLSNPKVAAVFAQFDPTRRAKLLRLRRLIFEVAARVEGRDALTEQLRWGEPAYRLRSNRGTTVRIGIVKANADEFMLLFHCQTNLISTFRKLYAEDISFAGNRAIVLSVRQTMPMRILRECVERALTYQRSNGRLSSRKGSKSARQPQTSKSLKGPKPSRTP